MTNLSTATIDKRAPEMLATRDEAFDPRHLRNALGQFATGVTVITARGPSGRMVGMTANSFTSVSMDPPLVLWCPRKMAPSLPEFAEATHFAVHVLGAGQEHIARHFATPADNKFEGLELAMGASGTPIIPNSIALFECRTVQSVDAGDHILLLGEVENYTFDQGNPLLFHAGVMRPL